MINIKKYRLLLLSAAIYIAIFSGCSKAGSVVEDKKLKPTQPIKAEDLLPEDKFYGTFANDGYTMTVEKDDGEQMHITVNSVVKDTVGYEWEIYSLFSANTYRINYTGVVKTVIHYDKNGKETSRETEYENGVGRIQFSDTDNFKWENSMDSISNTVFERK